MSWNIGLLANGEILSCTVTVSLAGACAVVSNTASIHAVQGDSNSNNNSSTTQNGGINVVLDPGFEAGGNGDSPNWAELSTSFGSPLCTLATCGSGGGTAGPRSGNVWAWFGGAPAGSPADTSSLQQSVIIPAGSTKLEFQTRFGFCSGGAADYLRVLIDGTEVFRQDSNYSSCGETSYVQNEIDVSALADGTLHALRFEASTGGMGSHSNFGLDDVAIISGAVCGTGTADLAIVQNSDVGGGALFVGGAVAIALRITNHGPGAASSIHVTDSLPAQLAFSSSTCGATVSGTEVSFGIPTLASGEDYTCNLTATVSATGTMVNSASVVAATPPDPNPANNTSTAQIGASGGALASTAVPGLERWALVLLFCFVARLGLRHCREP